MKCECEFGCSVGEECPIMFDQLEDDCIYMIVCEGCAKVIRQINPESLAITEIPPSLCPSCHKHKPGIPQFG